MTQRLVAACLAVPAVIALLAWTTFGRLPYATYRPGETIDVLGESTADVPVVEVDGAKTYPDEGQLRMTTVRVSPVQEPDELGQGLSSLMAVWLDGDSAVYPYAAVHAEDETEESSRQEGAVQMSTSQESAIEVGMSEAGIDVPQVLKVAEFTKGLPAEDVMRVGDVLRTVNGRPVRDETNLKRLINAAPDGEPVRFGITRGDRERTVSVVPQVQDDGTKLIGITPGIDYDFPFAVRINIDERIGGPSAGLVFSLAVYDTLTPGSLTDGRDVAGTGEIYPNGQVGPIGGIQQKIAGARGDGVEVFLVPIDNCADAIAADNAGDMRLVMAETMHDVRVALEAYAEDPDADLPSCEDAPAVLAAAGR